MQFKKGVILLLLLIAILLPIAIPLTTAEKITIPQEKTKAIVLNEYNPEIPYDPLYLYVGGFDSDKGQKSARILLKFDLEEIQNYVKTAILQINVELTKGFATKLPYEIGLHKVTRNWINPGWNEQPPFEPAETASGTLLGNGTYNVDITETVREWLAAGSNFGLLLRGRDETQLNLKQIDTVSLIVVIDDSKPIEAAQPILTKPIDTGLIGDFDRNGCVDFKDFLLFRGAVGTGNGKYNLDGAGLVDNRDYGIFKRHFNEGCFELFDREIQKRLSKPALLAGDFDGNGCIGFEDFLEFSRAYGSKQGDRIYDENPRESIVPFKQAVNPKVISKYDLNADLEINFPDYIVFSQNYNKGCDEVQPELNTEQLGKQAATKTAVDCNAYGLEGQRNECWIIKAGFGDSSLCENIVDSESKQNEANLQCICRKKAALALGESIDAACPDLDSSPVIEDEEVKEGPLPEYEYVMDCRQPKKVADFYCGKWGAHSYEVGKTTKSMIYLPSQRVVTAGENRDYISVITCYIERPGGFSLTASPTVREPTLQDPEVPSSIPAPRRISSCYEEARLK